MGCFVESTVTRGLSKYLNDRYRSQANDCCAEAADVAALSADYHGHWISVHETALVAVVERATWAERRAALAARWL